MSFKIKKEKVKFRIYSFNLGTKTVQFHLVHIKTVHIFAELYVCNF